jgi:hypothetical protein
MGPTQPPGLRVRESPSLGVKRPDREPDHLSPCSAEINTGRDFNSTYPYVRVNQTPIVFNANKGSKGIKTNRNIILSIESAISFLRVP